MARLRIIGGSVGGRLIQVPQRGTATRPTSDRVREALFSILDSALGGLEGTRVLDLFAGSGALGLEALSRGASEAVFVDHSHVCQRVIEQNVGTLGFTGSCRLMATPADTALSLLAGEGRMFDLVLADPPYADDPTPLVHKIGAGTLLAPGGRFVLEHASGADPERQESFALMLRRKYGDTAISLYQRDQTST